MVVGDQRDQLSVAVVLHQPIDPFMVDAAGHETVRALMRRVPLDELADLLRPSHAQQGRAHHRAIADPGTRVASRARLQGRAAAGHENVRRRGQRRIHRVLNPAAARPGRSGEYRLPIERRLRRARSGAEGRAAKSAFGCLPCLRRQREFERAGGEAEADRASRWRAGACRRRGRRA